MSTIGWIELLIVIGVIGIVLAAMVAFGMRRR
jgi:type II secretory pathway pseudopilin PulG